MARTRCGESASAKVKVNLPAASVLAWPTSSIPAASLMRTTSSPADGLLGVPVVIFPDRVAANRDDALAISRNITAALNSVPSIKLWSLLAQSCLRSHPTGLQLRNLRQEPCCFFLKRTFHRLIVSLRELAGLEFEVQVTE